MDKTPSGSSFNGIMGIAPWVYDCGSCCVSNADSNWYFSCSTSSCTAITRALTSQLTNPIAKLASYSDGYVLQLPSVSLGGESSLSGGYLIPGTANISSLDIASTTSMSVDSSAGTVTIEAGSNSYTALFDSGTNTLNVNSGMDSRLVQCTDSSYSSYYCVSGDIEVSMTIPSASLTAYFNVGNAETLANTGYGVFSELASVTTSSFEILGLPFFFGRNMVFVLDGKTSSYYNAAGPLVAF
jgi:hypothetical protein